MKEDYRITPIFGWVHLDTSLRRVLPDGSLEFGCRVRTYDNKPSEPDHLVSDEIKWSGIRLVYE